MKKASCMEHLTFADSGIYINGHFKHLLWVKNDVLKGLLQAKNFANQTYF